MKPLVLTFSAFGPYANKQTLDFSELKGRSFFLIHGPTGSGKTSILDAICYALYGTASGTSRTGKSMRSDHADLSVETEVDFEFVIGTKQYLVKRWPEQERLSKRGEGTTHALAKAELFQLSEKGDYELLSSTGRDVTEKIESLLGFKSEQFRQVVLLPQGDFRKLLTATSDEREAIMQTLFKTDIYRLIEDKLKAKAKELTQLHKELVQEQQLILQEASVTTLNELESNLKTAQEEEVLLRKKVGDLDQEFKNAQAQITTATRIQDQWNEREAAEIELKKLNEKISVVDQFRQNLNKALAAANLTDTETLLAQQTQDTATLQASRNALDKALQESKEQTELAQQQLTVQENKALEREAAAAEIHRLQQLSGIVEALAQTHKEALEAQANAQTALKQKNNLQAQFDEAQKAHQRKTEESQTLIFLSGQAQSRKMELEQLQSFLDKRNRLEQESKKLIMAERKLSSTQRSVEQAEEKLKDLKQVYGALQQAWLNGQAGVMASQLVPGTPCPVCGSLHHPQPAAFYAQTPDESTLKRKQAELEQAEKNEKTLQTSYHQELNERDLLAQKVQTLKEELGDYALMELEKLTLLLNQKKSSYQEAYKAAQQLETLQHELTALAAKQIDLQSEQENLDKAWNSANERYLQAQTIWEERQAAVPPELQDPQALQGSLRNAMDLQAHLTSDLEQAQKNYQQKSQALTKKQADFDNTSVNLSHARERLTHIQNEFTSRLKSSGFLTVDEYLKTKWSQERIQKVQERIKDFELNLSAAQQRAQRSKEITESLPRPDLAKLQHAADTCKEAYEAALRHHSDLLTTLKSIQRWLDRLMANDQKMNKLASRYAVMGKLSEIANGQNDYRLTLQRFVLGALLDDVALAANERLKMMSKGRYYLQRTMDRTRKNSAGGLDLEVFDNYTGFARGVGTLSGGETFLASLSLALGLVDVVQSYAGGIHLDTLFVDEGFGTLDPESLDFAIKALIDLQQGGRLVGIISHVPELKERIDARLEVTPTAKGSVASFKVG
ncbi:AAA family ATPase [Desulfitobacterium sp. AusDCA]|uniref:AAA family ATPase n=1 Tax=Desulfitobacterium sp. AusDCA TaxID=3240383 RepID=UPI003DA74F6B